VKRSDSLLDGS